MGGVEEMEGQDLEMGKWRGRDEAEGGRAVAGRPVCAFLEVDNQVWWAVASLF